VIGVDSQKEDVAVAAHGGERDDLVVLDQ